MKQIATMLTLASLAAVSGISYAATGYVDDSAQSIVRTGHGDCLHTHRWGVETAVAECEPEIVAARDALDVAAVEVVVRTEKNPIRLQGDTLFPFDSDKLTDDGKARLNDMLGELTAATLMEQKIQITGYTDRIGPDAYNLELSKRRAAVVRDYLVSRGVVPGFIEMIGLGAANPLVDCSDQRGQSLVDCLAPNRRTEIEFSAVELVEIQETAPVEK